MTLAACRITHRRASTARVGAGPGRRAAVSPTHGAVLRFCGVGPGYPRLFLNPDESAFPPPKLYPCRANEAASQWDWDSQNASSIVAVKYDKSWPNPPTKLFHARWQAACGWRPRRAPCAARRGDERGGALHAAAGACIGAAASAPTVGYAVTLVRCHAGCGQVARSCAHDARPPAVFSCRRGTRRTTTRRGGRASLLPGIRTAHGCVAVDRARGLAMGIARAFARRMPTRPSAAEAQPYESSAPPRRFNTEVEGGWLKTEVDDGAAPGAPLHTATAAERCRCP